MGAETGHPDAAGRSPVHREQGHEPATPVGDGRPRGEPGSRAPGPGVVVEVARPSNSVTGGFDRAETDQTNRLHSLLPPNPVTSLWPAARPFRQIHPPSLPVAV